ncbi:unnamed protein product, partial [Allacma fusca]
SRRKSRLQLLYRRKICRFFWTLAYKPGNRISERMGGRKSKLKSKSSPDSNSADNNETAKKAPQEDNAAGDSKVEASGLRDSNIPVQPRPGEDEKEEIDKQISKVDYIKSNLPEKTNVRDINTKVEIKGSQVGVVQPPDSPDALNIHDVTDEKVLQTGAIQRGFVLTDGNSKAQGNAVYSIVDTLIIEAGATDVGAVGSQKAVDLALAIADKYANTSGGPQKSEAQPNKPPATASDSSNPGSGSAPVKKHPDNVWTLKDYEDTTDGGTLGGNTDAAGSPTQDIRDEEHPQKKYLKVDLYQEEAILVFFHHERINLEVKNNNRRINTNTPTLHHIQIPMVILSQAVCLNCL